MPNKTTTHFSARKRLTVVAIATSFASAPAWSNPTAPQVVNGSASFSQQGNLLTVNNTNGAIINWNTFSIGANETTRFIQSSAASSVLNRVISNDPSVLLGALSSNGKVWLVNPAGIMVGRGAKIDVAGFIASTLNVRNEDFLAGRLNFGATPNAGSIRNYGQITTPSGGSVYLIAPAVENHGIINAPNGEVILAAGQTAQLLDTGTPGVKVDITGAEGNVTNLGEIVAEAGRIGMAGVLVKNSGTLNASSLVKEGGRIFLKARQKIELTDGSSVQADGTKGGSIVAKTEDNGQITGELLARGILSAQGDGTKGSGGFVETSAAKVDLNRVSVNTLGGTWLLDPYDFTVAASGGDITGSALAMALGNGSVTIQTTNSNVSCTGASCGSGTASGNGDINVNDAVNVASTAASTGLTLNAWRNININQPITKTGSSPLNLNLNANSGAASGASSVSSAVALNGGTLGFSGGTLSLNDGSSISNALVAGANTINFAVSSSSNAMLDGVTLGGNLQVNANSYLTIRNGLTLNNGKVYLGDGATSGANANLSWNGTQTIGGSGEVVFNALGGAGINPSYHDNSVSPWTLTLGSGVTVRSLNQAYNSIGGDNLINNGTIMDVVVGPASLINNGTLRGTTNGGLWIRNLASNTGTIQIDAGASVTDPDDADFINAVSGVIKGNGTLFLGPWPAMRTLINNGTLSPGDATTAGKLSINGNLINNGTIQAKIGGAAAGQYDVLAVNGNATLGGTLNASTINGFAPANADSFSFLTAGGTSSGTFSTRNLPSGFSVGYSLAANEAARLVYSAGAKIFTNAGGGLNWDKPGNWAGSALPGPTDDVVLSAGYAVTHGTGADTVGTLAVNSNNSLSVSGGSLTVNGATTVGGTLTTSGGTLNLNGAIANTGTLAVSAGTLNLGGTITAAGLGNLVGTGGTTRLTGTLANTGGTLTLNNATGNFDIAGTVTGGTLAVVNGSASKYLSTNAMLDGVTLGGNLQVNANSYLTIRNGLTLNNGKVYLGDGATSGANANLSWNGTQTIGGSGEVVFNALGGAGINPSYHDNSVSPWTLTLGSGVTVRSLNQAYNSIGGDNLINNGTIMDVVVGPASLINNGTLRGTTNGGLWIRNLASNTGTIQIDAGASVTDPDDADFINAVSGVIKGNGTLFLGPWPAMRTLINNGTLSPGDATTAGKLSINGNLINNGTIQAKIGGAAAGQYDVLAVNGNATLGGTLNASTINGFAPANADSFSFLTAGGTSSGTFSTRNLPSGFSVGYSLAANEAARLVYSAGAKIFTNAGGGLNWDKPGNWAGSALPGPTDDVVLSAGYAVTHGTGADTVGTLAVNSNNSLSVSGGSLTVNGATTVGGTLTTSGGTLNLNGAIANTGTLAVSAGTLNLGGTITAAGLGNLVGTGGTTRLTGTLANTGGTLTLNNATGNFDIAGTVTGGTLAVVNGSASKYLSTNAMLDGVTLGGNLQVNANSYLTIRNGLTLNNGKVYLGDGATSGANANLSWNGTQTIGGSGEVVFNALGGAGINPSYHDNSVSPWTLTLGSGVTVRSLNQAYNSIGGDNLINNGTIMDVVVGPASLINNGTLRGTTNGGLWIRNLASNTGTIQIDAGASVTDPDDADFINAVSGVIKGNGTLFLGPWPAMRTLINNGTLSPGDATTAGKLSINGNLINNGTIQAKIGGAAAGQYDVLAVNGNATLGGTLNASTINGFAPANADSFSFLTAGGTSSGTFSTRNLPSGFSVGYSLAANEAARLVYSAGAKIFTNAGGGLNWDKPGNWAGSALPGPTDDVVLSAGYAVTHGTGADTVGTLAVNSNNSLSVSGGSLTVNGATTVGGTLTTSGGTLNLNGAIANTGTLAVSAGTLNLGGTITAAGLGNLVGTGGTTRLTGTLANTGGTLTLNNATGNFDIAGTVTGGTLAVVNGSASKYLSTNAMLDGVTLGGNLQVNANSYLTIRNGLTLNNGKVYLGDGATSGANANLSWNGTQTIGGSGEVVFNALGGAGINPSYHDNSVSPWTLTLGSGVTVRSLNQAYNSIGGDNLINNGTIMDVVVGPASLINNGTLRGTTNGGLWIRNLASNTGTIQIDAGASVTDPDDADFINAVSGVIKGNGTLFLGPWPAMRTLINNGTLSPGDATTAGKLSINGNLINNGTIQAKIGGAAAGQYDVLAVNGNATLGGTLNASTINGYTPVGQSFDVITAGSVSGSFSTSNVSAGSKSSLFVTSNAVTVTAAGAIAPIPPTLSQCIADPATLGCSTVLPTLGTCTIAPTTAGCSAVLPTLGACTTNPAAAGCSVVLPTLTICTASPATAGCSVVLPTLSACTASPTVAGCSVVLPTLTICTASPATAGCSVVLPTLSACTTSPTVAGCSVVLPTLATCATSPTTAGCSAVLPSVASCTANPALAGCAAILPTSPTTTATATDTPVESAATAASSAISATIITASVVSMTAASALPTIAATPSATVSLTAGGGSSGSAPGTSGSTTSATGSSSGTTVSGTGSAQSAAVLPAATSPVQTLGLVVGNMTIGGTAGQFGGDPIAVQSIAPAAVGVAVTGTASAVGGSGAASAVSGGSSAGVSSNNGTNSASSSSDKPSITTSGAQTSKPDAKAEEKKKDEEAGSKKQAGKPVPKKLATCS